MAAVKTSLSFTPELAAALRALARKRHEPVSRLVETLLRESSLIGGEIRQVRLGSRPRAKKGRSVDELLTLGRAARASWKRKLRSGKVKVAGWKA